MKTDLKLTIGKAAKLAKVSVETIRYYERAGMISRPGKLKGSYREYSRDSIQRVHFIKRAQELGFKLSEILELLCLRVKGRTTPEVIRAKADQKLRQVEEKIAELNRIRSALLRVRECCDKQDAGKSCPILENFYESENVSAVDFVGSLTDSSK